LWAAAPAEDCKDGKEYCLELLSIELGDSFIQDISYYHADIF
jgi:hypothetical protein